MVLQVGLYMIIQSGKDIDHFPSVIAYFKTDDREWGTITLKRWLYPFHTKSCAGKYPQAYIKEGLPAFSPNYHSFAPRQPIFRIKSKAACLFFLYS